MIALNISDASYETHLGSQKSEGNIYPASSYSRQSVNFTVFQAATKHVMASAMLSTCITSSSLFPHNTISIFQMGDISRLTEVSVNKYVNSSLMRVYKYSIKLRGS